MATEKYKPVKRSEHIAALSRDHHAGLLFCWKIKEGLRKNVPLDKILKYINFFWDGHLKEHFREEETLLFNQLDDGLGSRGRSEHLMIEERVHQLNHLGGEMTDEYFAFAELLTKHIRFEERILFPHLETALSASVLRQAGDFLSGELHAAFTDNYPDEFWSKNYPSS